VTTRGLASAAAIGEVAGVTPAEIIELARAAARRGRRGPPADYGRFPAAVSEDELVEHFFFDETDRRLIARRRGDSNRLGFALQLGTVRYLGRFLEDPADIPPAIVRYVAGKLEIADRGVLGEYGRGEARWDHQAEIRREYGLREFSDPAAQAELVEWLQARAWVGAETHRVLFDRAVDHLIASKVILPGASVLWRLVGAVSERANERGWTLVAGRLTDAERQALLALLCSSRDGEASSLERLRRGPVKPTADGVLDALVRLHELQQLAPELTGIAELPFARVRALIVDARTRRAGDIQDLGELRRLATLAAFATLTEQAAQDEVLDHVHTVLDDIEHRAETRQKAKRLQSAPVIDTAGLRLADAAALILDETIADPQVRPEILARLGRASLAQAVEEIRALARPSEEGHRKQMLAGYNTVRRFLPLLLDTVGFHCTDAREPAIRALQALRAAVEHQRKLTSADVPLELVSRAWKQLVEPEPGRVDRRAYTFWALEQLRDGLHRRDVYVSRSDRWGDPRTILLDDRSWKNSKPDTCRSLGLPQRPKEFVSQLSAELDSAYARTREYLHRDNPVFAVADGRLDLYKLDALQEPDSLLWLRERQHAMLPDAELPEVLLEMAARTHFAEAFTHEREPNAQLADLHISIIAVLIAQACNVGWRPVVNDGIPALRGDRLKWVAHHYIRPETLIAANARIVDLTRNCGWRSCGAAGTWPRSTACGSSSPTAPSTHASTAATSTAGAA
jgi:Domain of unknown function (DUF4158)/Tn3 transposase DDE domain